MGRHGRLRTSRYLLVLFVIATAVPTAALVGLGWQLLKQDDDLARQQLTDRLEGIADRVVAGLRADLDALEGRSDDRDVPGAMVVTVDPAGQVRGSQALLFVPAVPEEFSIDSALWQSGQAAEDAQRYAEAIAVYKRLATSPDAAIRAGALVRLARSQRLGGGERAALETYAALAREESARVFGDPAPLVARLARLRLLRDMGDTATWQTEAEILRRDLEQGRWPVGAVTFEDAWRQVIGTVLPASEPRFPESFAVAAGVAALWGEWRDAHGGAPEWSGRRSAWFDGRQVTLAWTGSNGGLVIRALPAQAVLDRWLPVWQERNVVVEITEPDGRPVIAASLTGARPVTRTPVNSGLPWIVRLDSPLRPEDLADVVWRRRRLQLVLGLATLVGLVGGYSVVRAMRRESAVARLQSDFVSAVSHEFRTPLTSMSHLIELLRGRPNLDEARRARYYEALDQEAGRLRRFVDTLLDFGKAQAGAGEYKLREEDLSVVVSDAVAQFRSDEPVSSRTIEVTGVDAALPVAVDREAFGLVLRNLLENAVKYSPTSSPIHVGLACDTGRRRAEVRVTDHGQGIPPGEHEAIFEKFVRGAAARSSGTRGTGVGLALAREIVRSHGGDIGLTSEPGAGSTFTVWLPIVSEANP